MYKKNPKTNAKSYIHTRKAHETELAEDYVELIADLISKEGEARIVDIANHLGISKATVNQTINRLVKKGFLTSKPYRSIHLTKKGKITANHSSTRHKIVFDFLIALGIDKETAELDSEGMEHHVGSKTLNKLKNLTYKLTKKK
tara:strand:+ start:5207 stop:5638 length:432 start_codon:yes stop_codon:yes gene_type:complete